MKLQLQRLLVCLACFSSAGLCLAGPLATGEKPAGVHEKPAEPCYEGRTLSSWLEDFAYTGERDSVKRQPAERAIRAMGTKAIPGLVGRLRSATTLEEIDDNWCVIDAFEALGAEARPAIPELIELLAPAYDAAKQSPSEPDGQANDRRSLAAVYALRSIGDDSVPPLVEALRSEHVKIRFGAAMALSYFRRFAEVTLPALITALGDENYSVRWRAARTIGELHSRPDLSVPALARRVSDDPAFAVRLYAMMALKRFGPAAVQAIPALRQAANEKNGSVRSEAKAALEKIDPVEVNEPPS